MLMVWIGEFSCVVLLEKPSKPLVELNLPPAVIACYHRLGISHLFAWQAECLQKASARGE